MAEAGAWAGPGKGLNVRPSSQGFCQCRGDHSPSELLSFSQPLTTWSLQPRSLCVCYLLPFPTCGLDRKPWRHSTSHGDAVAESQKIHLCMSAFLSWTSGDGCGGAPGLCLFDFNGFRPADRHVPMGRPWASFLLSLNMIVAFSLWPIAHKHPS